MVGSTVSHALVKQPAVMGENFHAVMVADYGCAETENFSLKHRVDLQEGKSTMQTLSGVCVWTTESIGDVLVQMQGAMNSIVLEIVACVGLKPVPIKMSMPSASCVARTSRFMKSGSNTRQCTWTACSHALSDELTGACTGVLY